MGVRQHPQLRRMTTTEILDRFNGRQRGADLPFVVNDEVEVLEGIYRGRQGTVELLAYAESPMQFLVDFGDGTDEYFPASALRLLDHAA